MKMLPNHKRAGTPHEVEHEWAISCYAPPRCERKQQPTEEELQGELAANPEAFIRKHGKCAPAPTTHLKKSTCPDCGSDDPHIRNCGCGCNSLPLHNATPCRNAMFHNSKIRRETMIPHLSLYDSDFPLQIHDISGETCMVIHEPGKIDIVVNVHKEQLPALNALRNLIAVHFNWQTNETGGQ